MAHSQTEADLLRRVQDYFRRFPDVQRSIAVKIDYRHNSTAPLPPAELAQQRVRVWLFERSPQADPDNPMPPYAVVAPAPAGLPAYPWNVGSAWATADPAHPPARGHYVIPLPASLLESATNPLPPAAQHQTFMIDLYRIYQRLRTMGYVL